MAGMSLQHPWAFSFGLLGNLISFMTLLAPLPTFYRIYKNKSTQGFQSVPYVVALFSAMLWIYYALLKSNETLLITINSAGCVIETTYIVIYLAYAPKAAKVFTAKILLGLNVGVFGAILLVTMLLSEGEKRVIMLGWVCVGFSVSVFVAPLSVIVLATHMDPLSVRFMSDLTGVRLVAAPGGANQERGVHAVHALPLTHCQRVVWFLYGLLIKDKYVALPNILGFTFGVIKMGLYAFYRSATPTAVAKDVAKVPEHIVNISKNGAAAVELKCSDVCPVDSPPVEKVSKENDVAQDGDGPLGK